MITRRGCVLSVRFFYSIHKIERCGVRMCVCVCVCVGFRDFVEKDSYLLSYVPQVLKQDQQYMCDTLDQCTVSVLHEVLMSSSNVTKKVAWIREKVNRDTYCKWILFKEDGDIPLFTALAVHRIEDDRLLQLLIPSDDDEMDISPQVRGSKTPVHSPHDTAVTDVVETTTLDVNIRIRHTTPQRNKQSASLKRRQSLRRFRVPSSYAKLTVVDVKARVTVVNDAVLSDDNSELEESEKSNEEEYEYFEQDAFWTIVNDKGRNCVHHLMYEKKDSVHLCNEMRILLGVIMDSFVIGKLLCTNDNFGHTPVDLVDKCVKHSHVKDALRKLFDQYLN